MDEEHEDLTPDSLTPDSCNNNHPAFISEPEKKIPAGFQEDLQGDMEHSMSAAVMFPVEIATRFPEDTTLAPGPRPGLLLCSLVERSCCERYTEKIDSEKRDISELEFGEEAKEQKKKTLNPESGTAVGNNKGKKNRRMTENVSSPPEHNVITVPEREKEPEWKTRDHNMSENRTRNRGCSGLKSEVLKPENLLTQNSVCPSRSRRRCGAIERRAGGLSESGSDSGSSSGSVRASRGSWGSWSSASSMEGDKDHGVRTHACTTSYRKRDLLQNYPTETDCYQSMNNNYKASRYFTNKCQSEIKRRPSYVRSFWMQNAPIKIQATTVCFCYSPLPTFHSRAVLQDTCSGFLSAAENVCLIVSNMIALHKYFTWSSANSHCNSPCSYTVFSNHLSNGPFQSGFPNQGGQNVNGSQSSWSNEQPQESPSTWNSAACVGSKPYFSGTRSLSPMSGLFGSIWTP
uniref:Uncharacterized protein n=1 Tax=Poecilia formosa TaxID=48698 RepID=A0A096LSJ9_POEFO